MHSYIKVPLFVLSPVIAAAYLAGCVSMVVLPEFLLFMMWINHDISGTAFGLGLGVMAALAVFTYKFTGWNDDKHGEAGSMVIIGCVFYFIVGLAALVAWRIFVG